MGRGGVTLIRERLGFRMNGLPDNVRMLQSWANARAADFAAADVNVGPVHQPTENPEAASYLDIEGKGAWARATVWPGMFADLLALDAKTGEALLNRHVERLAAADLDQIAGLAGVRRGTDPSARVRALTARIVSRYVGRGALSVEEMIGLISSVSGVLSGLEIATERAAVRSSANRASRSRGRAPAGPDQARGGVRGRAIRRQALDALSRMDQELGLN
jgi:hypothetical protein